MATGLTQYITQLEGVIARLRSDAPDLAVGFASDIIANVQERIQTQGTSAKGTALKAYTQGYLKFKKNPKAYKRGNDLGLGSNRYTGKTDYTLTGRMWSDIRPLRVEGDGKSIRVIMGAQKTENRKKLEGLMKRDGVSPLKPNENEIAIGEDNLKQRIMAYFDVIK